MDKKPLSYATERLNFISQIPTGIRYVNREENIYADFMSPITQVEMFSKDELPDDQQRDEELQELLNQNDSSSL